MQERDAKGRDERSLFGGLGDDRVARDQRCADLAEENGKRKIPRADASKHAAAAVAQFVALAGRTRHRLGHQRAARLRGVIAAIIDRLAKLGERVVERLAGLVLQQRKKPAAIDLEPVSGAFERRGARIDRRCRPGRKARGGGGHCGANDRLVGLAHQADGAAVDRRVHDALDAGERDAIDKRRGFRALRDAVANFAQQRVETCALAEFDAGRILPLGPIKIARQRDFPIARRARVGDQALRPAQDLRDRHIRIGGSRHERGIGAVLKEPPHQISEEIAIVPDRGIDAAGGVGKFGNERIVERFAHAVETLEFVTLDAVGILDDAGDGKCVMGGELRK